MRIAAGLAVAVCALVGAIALWTRRFARPPAPYRVRACQGRAWRRAFPAVPREEMRAFLRLLVASFAWREADMLRFAPQDRILAIYRAEYPRTGGMDNLELESFAIALARRYGVDLGALWRPDLTLGELFARCRAAA